MTLAELNARIYTLNECYDILMEMCPECEKVYTVRDRYRELRDEAWTEFERKMNELSKQA